MVKIELHPHHRKVLLFFMSPGGPMAAESSRSNRPISALASFVRGSFFSASHILFFLASIIVALALTSCGGGGGGGGNSSPSNTGGGFTLQVSGGTLNDGSGTNGLSVLATLRDSSGWGPTLPWTITITDPDSYLLVVEYSDPRQGSYMSWEWAGWDPSPGTYRATATNGFTTLSYDFTVSTTVLSRPAPNAGSFGNDITVTWPAVGGAGSYSYDICAPDATCISGITAGLSSTATFSTLANGDYLVQVKAYATDRNALYANHAASPSFASQEKVSEHSFSFPVGGDQSSANYSFNAAGGVLDWGLRGPGNTPIYGTAFWTSIIDTAANPDTAPSGNWNIQITDPNGRQMNYIYPASSQHYAYWYYSVEPVSNGTYTVTATYGTASKSAVFSLANTTPALAPFSYSQISATKNITNDITITWPAVTNANSYYVSLWADIWDNSAKQWFYEEVWGKWVATTGTTILKSGSTLPAGLRCDVYVTAYAVDMSLATPPASPPTRADMSENYYGYPLPFLTP
jgi:hypothetical protein